MTQITLETLDITHVPPVHKSKFIHALSTHCPVHINILKSAFLTESRRLTASITEVADFLMWSENQVQREIDVSEFINVTRTYRLCREEFRPLSESRSHLIIEFYYTNHLDTSRA